MAQLFAEMREEIVRNALAWSGAEMLLEGSQLLLQGVLILLEIRLVELLQAVLLLGNLLGRLQNGETVLRYECLVVPRLAFLIMVGRSVSMRHESHQNGNRNQGEEDAIEVGLHAQFVLMIETAHFLSEE